METKKLLTETNTIYTLKMQVNTPCQVNNLLILDTIWSLYREKSIRLCANPNYNYYLLIISGEPTNVYRIPKCKLMPIIYLIYLYHCLTLNWINIDQLSKTLKWVNISWNFSKTHDEFTSSFRRMDNILDLIKSSVFVGFSERRPKTTND